MDDQLEELRTIQIEHALKQFSGLGNESLVDVEDEIWDPAAWNAISANYSGIEHKDLEYNEYGYYDNIEYNNNVDLFTLYNRDLLHRQNMICNSVYEQTPARLHASTHKTSLAHYNRQTSPILPKVESHLNGFGAKQEEEKFVGKKCLCRHFLKGSCNRGNSCDFQHDESIFCSEEQKVFIGGLPPHITAKALKDAIKMQGYTVLNMPKVLQGFSPQICLGSVQEAKNMIKRGQIVIDGAFADVRPYEASAKDRLKLGHEDGIKRSVFIGGLLSGTTGWMIKEQLAGLGFTTVRHPIVKSGFAPQVVLESVEQAQQLVKLKNIKINKSTVEIRAYIRHRF